MTNVNGNYKPKGKNLVKYSKITAAKGRIKGGNARKSSPHKYG